MATLERPKLRPLPAQRFDHDGQSYALIQDPAGAFANPVLVPLDAFVHICRHLTASVTLADIQSRVLHETGQQFPSEILAGLVDQLDQAMVLDGPTFASFKDAFRRSRCGLRRWRADRMPRAMAALAGPAHAVFRGAGGAGPSRDRRASSVRGGPGRPQPPHRLPAGRPGLHLVVQGAGRAGGRRHVRDPGVAHQPCRRRFVLTLKDFETPLGTVRPIAITSERIAQARRRRSCSTMSWSTGPNIRSSSRWSSFSTCWAGADLLDRADPRRLVPGPPGAGDRPDR